MRPTHSATILPEPPSELKELSRQLAQRIREEISATGPVPFSRYMEMALYEPGLGYYSAGLNKFGEEGDFVTAPQLGNLFARGLAAQVREAGSKLGQYEILEIGAGTGQLAHDLLTELADDSALGGYRILERSADLVQRQQSLLSDVKTRVEWLQELPVEPWRGIIIANEVVDALAVERFRVCGDSVQQLQVDIDGENFKWATGQFEPEAEAQVNKIISSLEHPLPDGYTSEICLQLPQWLQAVTESLQSGVALMIDYGYPRQEYYMPQRSDGTLIVHYRHRAHDDPLTWPGLQDISAFVDFTALAEAGTASGLCYSGYTSQSKFLFGCGLEHLLAGMESLPELQRLALAHEIRELTLPGAMGEKFQVMALTREFDFPLRGFEPDDLSHRL